MEVCTWYRMCTFTISGMPTQSDRTKNIIHTRDFWKGLKTIAVDLDIDTIFSLFTEMNLKALLIREGGGKDSPPIYIIGKNLDTNTQTYQYECDEGYNNGCSEH